MKRSPAARLLLALLLSGGAVAQDATVPAIGSRVTAGFTDVRWLPRTLPDLRAERATVLFFTGVDCPLVRRYLPRLQELALEFGPRGVVFVAVNSQAGEGLTDAAAQVVELAPALVAGKDFDGALARACGVDRSAAAVVLDAGQRLVFRGRIDGQYRYSGAAPQRGREDLRQALTELLDGAAVSVAATAWEGCKLTFPTAVGPNTATWADGIGALVQRACQDCHRPGGEGPFDLLTADDLRRRAAMVAEVVAQGRMPPWYGSERHGAFVNHRGLGTAERELLLGWLLAGAPAGDPERAPAPRQFAEGPWRMGEPDLVLKVPVPIRVPADGYVPYKYFVLPFHFAHDTWVEAIEIRPENRRVLHHCNLARVRLGEKFTQDGFVTGYVPGGDPMVLDPGTAVRIPKGSALALQAHYVTTGQAEVDHLSVGLRFPRQLVQKELQVMIAADFRFEIPPGARAHPVRAVRRFPADALGIGLFVHMHLRGRDMRVTAQPPDGEPESLLLVPGYAFDWQQSYRWDTAGRPFARGTRIEALAHFDNSAWNPFNPDPTVPVRFGLETEDEMMYAFLFWVERDQRLGLRIDPATGRVR